MDRLIPIGRALFGVGLAGFGLLQFVYGDFIAGRAPAWPEALPGRLVWAYMSGAIFFGVGVAILLDKRAREAAFLAATLIALWALVRNVPVVAGAEVLSGAWTRMGKSIVLCGGSLAIGAACAHSNGDAILPRNPKLYDSLLYAGRSSLGLFMILCGIQHFRFEAFVSTLVPAWIGSSYFWTYFAGIALLAGGVGLLIPRFASAAALCTGVMIFLWVILLHIPRAASALYDARNEWTSVFEATALSGLAFVLSRIRPGRGRPRAAEGAAVDQLQAA